MRKEHDGMARHFQRDRRPRDGNPYGDRYTRHSGWEPTRSDDDWAEDDDAERSRYYRTEGSRDDFDRRYMRDAPDWDVERSAERPDWTMQGRGEATRDFWQSEGDEHRRRYSWDHNPYQASDRDLGEYGYRPAEQGRYRERDREYGRPRTEGIRSQRYGGERDSVEAQSYGTGWERGASRYQGGPDVNRFAGDRDFQTRFEDTGMTEDWRGGPHVGRGPRGYRRSDERIRDDVCERLWDEGMVDASDVDVSVENGEVTLDGTVNSRFEKRLAENTAEAARGVTDVHNRLRVRNQQIQTQGRRTNAGYAVNERAFADRDRLMTNAETGRVDMTQTVDRSSVRVEMGVVAANGDELGSVKEVRANDFLLDRPMHRDIYVPFNLIRSATNDNIFLSVASDELARMDLDSAPLLGDADSGADTTTNLT
jgi:osmotically-inducible protein OsmY